MLWKLCLPPAALDPEAPSDRGMLNVPLLAGFLFVALFSGLTFYARSDPTSSRGGGLGLFLSDALLTFPLAFVFASLRRRPDPCVPRPAARSRNWLAWRGHIYGS